MCQEVSSLLKGEGGAYPLAMYVNVIAFDIIHELLGCGSFNKRDASAALVGA